MSWNNVLIAVISLLFIFNFFVIYNLDLQAGRWARLLSTISFMAILVYSRSKYTSIHLVFLLLFLSDCSLFFYEVKPVKIFTFLIRIGVYLLLIRTVLPEIKNLRTKLFQKLIFLQLGGLNLVMLYLLLEMVPSGLVQPYTEVLYYIYGAAMIALVIVAISYSNRYSDKIAGYFTAASLFLVFSDATSFIAYYLGFHEFYFPARFFYILAIAGLVKFNWVRRNHKAVAELESL